MKLHNVTKLNYKLMRQWLFDLNIKNSKKLPCIKAKQPDLVQAVVAIVMANPTPMIEPVNAQPGVKLVNIVTNQTTLFKYDTRNHLKMPMHSLPTSPMTMSKVSSSSIMTTLLMKYQRFYLSIYQSSNIYHLKK